MTNKLLLPGILAFTALLACSPQAGNTIASAKAALASTVPQLPVLLTDAVTDMTYSGIHDDDVTLTDGHWEGEPFAADGASRPAVGIIDDFMLAGDLDGDGADEVVVFLWKRCFRPCLSWPVCVRMRGVICKRRIARCY